MIDEHSELDDKMLNIIIRKLLIASIYYISGASRSSDAATNFKPELMS